MRKGPDRQSLMGSAAIHVLAVALIWFTQLVRPEPMEFTAYRIELVSPPPAEVVEPQPRATEELVVETPREPEPETPPPPEPERQEVQTPPPETPEEQPREEEEPEAEPAEESQPAAEEADPEEGEEGGEDIEVRMEGLRRDYPVYYENIIRQMHRCFRWQGSGGLEATVQFYITRDGSVEELDVVRESGNPAFDIEAMGAVECAGNGRFGPLPEDLRLDRLPVRFNFRPRGGGGDDLPLEDLRLGHED